MKGHDRVIELLNGVLACELAAMDQYFIHSQMYEDWGLTKLFERIAHEFDDEKMHATMIIQRILFLEGVPDMTTREGLKIGANVPDMLQNDLQLEYDVAAKLKGAISECEELNDYHTREIFEKLLEDTEQDHAYWLEQQLRLIDKIGLENYQQAQM
ncbi:bacterioferritin [Paraferrimonas sedimenticola]|uniref:Bacterioferritin n=1 Tax=Paraferrimonas sedimenticola TaxID=375674 RepID=A0AA37RY41_9GAMM|nr:bacterioferritin [Paraferrimonas sedimenticola]GLP97380.1 bacterioferritin [Paraferrimonas sedimenticola]